MEPLIEILSFSVPGFSLSRGAGLETRLNQLSIIQLNPSPSPLGNKWWARTVSPGKAPELPPSLAARLLGSGCTHACFTAHWSPSNVAYPCAKSWEFIEMQKICFFLMNDVLVLLFQDQPKSVLSIHSCSFPTKTCSDVNHFLWLAGS